MNLHSCIARRPRQAAARRLPRPVCIVVEGANDIAWLTSLSRILHQAERTLPDLGSRQASGELVLLPCGGGDLMSWADRLAPLGLPELHLYDREASPETELRRRAARQVNERPNCRAFVTRQRSLENYLHPRCIQEISGLEFDYGADEDVAALVARACYERQGQPPAWRLLPARARKRWRERTKKWLNRVAVELMTPALLAERDPAGEVRGWLTAIDELRQPAD